MKEPLDRTRSARLAAAVARRLQVIAPPRLHVMASGEQIEFRVVQPSATMGEVVENLLVDDRDEETAREEAVGHLYGVLDELQRVAVELTRDAWPPAPGGGLAHSWVDIDDAGGIRLAYEAEGRVVLTTEVIPAGEWLIKPDDADGCSP